MTKPKTTKESWEKAFLKLYDKYRDKFPVSVGPLFNDLLDDVGNLIHQLLAKQREKWLDFDLEVGRWYRITRCVSKTKDGKILVDSTEVRQLKTKRQDRGGKEMNEDPWELQAKWNKKVIEAMNVIVFIFVIILFIFILSFFK